MKKVILLLMMINILFGYEGYFAPFEGTRDITQGWDGGYSHGNARKGSPHTGKKLAYALDIAGNNFNVLAVKDGEIVDSERHYGFGRYVVIKHDDGLYSLYAHLSKIIKSTGKVKRGMLLGKSGNDGSWSEGAHLHFQLNITKELTTNLNNSRKVNFKGFSITEVDKINLSTRVAKTSKNHLYNEADVQNNSNAGIFDGAGSLVSSTEDVAGGSYDIAMMHPHSPYNSTVVFQWLYNIDSCSQIDLFSTSNKLDVTVKAKKWSGHPIKNAFNVTLNPYNNDNLSKGVTVKRPDSSSPWTTLAITSIKPIDSQTRIIAICKDNSNNFNKGNRVDISSPSLVDVTHNYYWTGTGSIISRLIDRNFEDPGVGMDIAVTYNSYNSLTSFQWYATDNCRKLKIRAYGNETNARTNEVKMKSWADKDWSSNKCSSSLPCTISAPKLDAYYVLKVKSSENAISSGGLVAECVQ